MIEPYVGEYWADGIYDDEHLRKATKKDKLFCGKCDLCGADVEDYDMGVVISSDKTSITDAVMNDDGVVVGDHIICGDCVDAVEHGDFDISIKRKAVSNGK